MPQIKIEISPQGEVKMEGVGFVGPACEAAMRPLQQAMAVTSEAKKPEYYQVAGAQQSA